VNHDGGGRKDKVTSLIVAMMLSGAVANPGEWGQWRGPERDGVSKAVRGLSPGPLTRRWSAEVGSGQSSPVVSGETAFVFTREGESEVARALVLGTGKVRWRTAYPAPYRVYPGAASYGGGPKSTPVVHDGRLFTLGIAGMLSAFDARDGRLLWQKDFSGRFPATAPPFGTSMSPLVVGGLLVVHAGGHDGGALLAFDPATGREMWALEGDGPSYSSPIVARFGGEPQLVVQVHRKILGVEPLNGRLLWSVPFVTPCDQNIVTPLQAKDVLVVSSLGQGTMGLRVARRGATWVPDTVWKTQEVSMYMSSPVLAGGRVLGLSHRKKGQYFALDPATGAVHWTGDPAQGGNAAFVVLPDGVLALGEDGELLVFAPGVPAATPIARHRVADSGTFAHPVPTARGLLVKDTSALHLHAPAPTMSTGEKAGR
jgi:outer membrane protein assembly factor BamB